MTTRKPTAKERILDLLRKGEPMLSMDMAKQLGLSKPATSEAAKELYLAGWIHVAEWRPSKKNAGNKVYAYGKGEDAIKPIRHGNSTEQSSTPQPFVPHADVAAAWLRNPL